MKFKGKSNGIHIIGLGSLDQEIFDRGILAVFGELLGFYHHSFVLYINQYYKTNNFLSNKLLAETLA
jgi:hypothetical protein